MLFNSFAFLIFFPVVTTLFFLLPHKFRWFHLLVASCIFYMYLIPVYILILLFTIIIDYIAGRVIESAEGGKRKLFLIISLVANIGILAFFKYYNFFAENVNQLFHLTNIHINITLLNIILPIGLSFHTFQAMSYTIEVYRGNQKAERHLGVYALYVMFYPQLVAGPIERPQNILHQFHEVKRFNFDNCKEGLKLILWGFFKKIVIADRLAIVVNNVYKSPDYFTGPALLITVIFFTFQLYCDFSGYSDIALGTAKVMGYDLMINFNLPFSSKSVSEFWRRWHISLSTWLNDYLFTPTITALRNWGKSAVAFGVLVTFFICGFWHGAAWKYVVFGSVHGVAIVYEFYTRKKRKKLFDKLPKWINNRLSTLLTVSYFVWSAIFFRAKDIRQALYVMRHLFSGWQKTLSYGGIKEMVTALGGNDTVYGTFNIAIGFLSIILLELIQTKIKDNNPASVIKGWPKVMRWGFYYFLIIAILFVGTYDYQEFIYFQF